MLWSMRHEKTRVDLFWFLVSFRRDGWDVIFIEVTSARGLWTY